MIEIILVVGECKIDIIMTHSKPTDARESSANTSDNGDDGDARIKTRWIGLAGKKMFGGMQ